MQSQYSTDTGYIHYSTAIRRNKKGSFGDDLHNIRIPRPKGAANTNEARNYDTHVVLCMYVYYYVFESFCNIFTPVFLSSQNIILKSICALSLSDHEWIIVKLWKHFYATTYFQLFHLLCLSKIKSTYSHCIVLVFSSFISRYIYFAFTLK